MVHEDLIRSHESGMRLQLAMLELWRNSGESLGGWKVGLTSGKNRDLMGPGFRPFGYILKSRILTSGSTLQLDRVVACQLEPELCFVVGSPIAGANLDPATVRAAIRSVGPAFEINAVRRSPKESPDSILIADDLSNWGIVAGAAIPLPPSGDLTAISVEVHRDGSLESAPDAERSMDDPFAAIGSLCRSLAHFGLGLEEGQRIITGAFSHHAVRAPGTWSARFEHLGDVSILIQ